MALSCHHRFLEAPGLECNKVQEALYLILGQDHKAAVITDKRRPFGRGKGQRAYVLDESWEDEDVFYEEELDDHYDYDQVPIESWQDDESTFDYDAATSKPMNLKKKKDSLPPQLNGTSRSMTQPMPPTLMLGDALLISS